jgi:hypothetical protein
MTCTERYYLQEPIASPMEGGQNGRVNVTAVDALTKYNITTTTKKLNFNIQNKQNAFQVEI